jgi:class 3 adenylate cyclase
MRRGVASIASVADDPRRTTDHFPRALWMIASAGHRYCLHREVRRSATGQRGRKCYRLQTSGAEDRWRTMNPLRTTVLMKADISGSTSRFHELLAADLQALLGEHRDFLARHCRNRGLSLVQCKFRTIADRIRGCLAAIAHGRF